MQPFRLKHFFLSSCIILAFGQCSPLRGYTHAGKTKADKVSVLPIADPRQSLLFKASIDLYDKHYSGLVLIKRTDEHTEHLTFVTEVGMKMFDFEISDTSFNLVYIFEPLNKPKLISLLKEDLQLMLLHSLYRRESDVFTKANYTAYRYKHGKRYYFFVNEKKLPTGIIVKGSIFKKAKVVFVSRQDLSPQSIDLKHKGFMRLNMNLNRITKAEP